MSRNGSVLHLGGALTDHRLRLDEWLSTFAATGPRDAQCSAGAQTCCQFSAQRASTLDVQRLVDRLMGDPHRLITRKLYPKPMSDLLRAPRSGPSSVLSFAVSPTTPSPHGWPVYGLMLTVVRRHRPCESVLDVGSQLVIARELSDLGALGATIAVPLGTRCSVLQPARTRRGIAPHLARNR